MQTTIQSGDHRSEDVELVVSSSRRDEIDNEFKPLFKLFESDGISITEIKSELKKRGDVSAEKWDKILSKMDVNHDNKLSYTEFVNLMSHSDGAELRELTRKRKFLKAAIQNILPKGEHVDFLESYNCCPPPVFMVVITIIEVIIFGVYAAKSATEGNPVTATTGVASYNPLMYKPQRRYEAWRFITYMFVHQGYLHLISNMVIQLLLGLPLEIVHKWWRLILIYVLGVLAGSLAHSITDTHSGLVGASGGGYALIGGHIAATILNWKEMNYKLCSGSIKRVLFSAPMRLSITLLYVIIDTGVAIYRRYFAAAPVKVGIAAHIGGLLAGLVLGVLILKNVRKLSWELKLGWVGLCVYLVFFIVSTFFNVFYKGYPATDWRPCCPS